MPGKSALARGISDADRLREKYDVLPNGCWQLRAGMNAAGYGAFRFEGRNEVAHRAAYMILVGPIPDGLELDHLCRNRSCVNPGHLEPVTRRENIRRSENFAGENSRKTHCPRGHAYDEANTYISPRGERICRTCHRDKVRASRQLKASVGTCPGEA